MQGRRLAVVAFAALVVCSAATVVPLTELTGAPSPAGPEKSAVEDRAAESFARLPLAFEANRGQVDPRVSFVSRAGRSAVFLTPGEAVLAMSRPGVPASTGRAVPVAERAGAVVRMSLVGADRAVVPEGVDLLPGRSNDLRGRDAARWQSNIPTYAKVAYRGLLPGTDLVFYGRQGHLEYDVILAPGADPRAVTVAVDGAEKLVLDRRGDLVLHTSVGPVRMARPVVYQNVEGSRRPVAGRFVLKGPDRVGFDIGRYDASRPLVIDPTLAYSFSLGGSGLDAGSAIAVDASGSAYVTGQTTSINFPTTAGAFDVSRGDDADVFVAKLNPAGTALVYSTYLGGSVNNHQDPNNPGLPTAREDAQAIAVDSSGNAYVTGETFSDDFPVTPVKAFQTTRTCDPQTFNGYCNPDAFVTELNPSGTALVYSTYLGGTGNELGRGIVAPSPGTAYVTGVTGWASAADFPTTAGSFQSSVPGGSSVYPNGFVAKFNTAATGPLSLVYSTFITTSGPQVLHFTNANAIAVDASGNAYVTGSTGLRDFPVTAGAFDVTYGGASQDGFVLKLNAAGSAALYGSYLGGKGDDEGWGIAVNASGHAFVTGATNSKNFPKKNAYDAGCGTDGLCNQYDECPPGNCLIFANDAFVTRINPAGTGLSDLVYSTYLGGAKNDTGFGIVLKGDKAFVTGHTSSTDFPTTAGRISGLGNVFVTKLAGTGSSLGYSTYLGTAYDRADGSGLGIAQLQGNAYVTGAKSGNAFVAKVSP